ncbi:TetR family transcriptional regulator [Psychromonas marina]|uniref:TetR family transcriptional regulator n=1 Tax=Psychromonas marina TaxID=88364 RepID=A0ABQ6DZC0_9GAMM|nr:TetR/AcrR family transcriptional regulator [Psychromonas marina]GLS90502.1 TetR family transcriptional regulator [Psychromonas marina]
MAKAGKQNRQDVVEKATNLYWEKGFHGTSMRNLQDVIDMRPGSIYAAFGSKEGLFKEALQYYTQQGFAQLTALKSTTGSPLKGLKAFVEMAVIDSQDSAPSGMCMLAKTISELTEENAELLAEAKSLLHKIELSFAATFIEAQAFGEVDKEKDAKQLARSLQIQIMGLRTYTRVNNDNKAIKEMIDTLFLAFSDVKK